jgi:hypothetical protein
MAWTAMEPDQTRQRVAAAGYQGPNEVLSWLAGGRKGAAHVLERAGAGRSFESIGDEWMAGVAAGRVGRRRGRARAYSATTVRDYARSYSNFLRPEFGPMVADDIGEVEWQMWVDRLSREGLSRSRITTHVAVASASRLPRSRTMRGRSSASNASLA